MTARIAALASGGGTNLQAILDHLDSLRDASRPSVALVASDRADAGALERARERGIPTVVLSKDDRTTGLDPILRQHDIDVVALAGYLKFLPAAVTSRLRGRVVNVHPALLPAFGGPGMYGIRVHEAVIAAGVRVSGVTVHFVDEQYDHGPIIAQRPVPVFSADTPSTLAERTLRVEHELYPRVVHAVATGQVTLDESGRVRGSEMFEG